MSVYATPEDKAIAYIKRGMITILSIGWAIVIVAWLLR